MRPSSPPGAVASASFAPEAADVDGVRLLVLDADSGEPVPGAEVAWSHRATDRARLGLPSRPEDSPRSHFDVRAVSARADDSGVAIVPRRQNLAVAARRDDLTGETALRWNETDEARISIRKEYAFAARVEDATGAPAVGVPVRFSRRRASVEVDRTALTRAGDGVAAAPLSEYDGLLLDERRVGVDDPWVADQVSTTFEELRKGPILLRLPPSAPLAIRVVGPDGRPLSERAEVLLGRSDEVDEPGTVSRLVGGPLSATTDAESVARFAYAPAGPPLAARVAAPSYDSVVAALGTLAEGVEGPAIEVRMGAARAVYVGRAVEHDDKPLAGARFALEIASLHGFRRDAYPAEVVADGAGRFSFSLDRSARTGFAHVALTMIDDGPIPRAGSVRTLPPAADAATDLGDVVCAREAFAEGRVVDRAGRPVAGMRVVLRGPIDPDAYREGTCGRGTTILRVGGAVTAEDGSFALPWPTAARMYEAGVEDFVLHALPPFADEVGDVARAQVRPPALGLTLKVAPFATLEGRLQLPPQAPLGKLLLDVAARSEIDGHPLANRRTYERRIDSRGRFVLGGLGPGSCDVRVLLAGSDRPLAEILDVALRDGETTNDPRLQGVELTGLAR